MGCGCKATNKGIANKAHEKWLVKEIYDHYQSEIGTTTIQYFTNDMRRLVLDWYSWVYPNSIKVNYKKANIELNKLFVYHKL